jgi:hypothetical protein
LEATTHEAVERAADKAAVKATRIIADAKAQEAK